jgi:hypothetical protein
LCAALDALAPDLDTLLVFARGDVQARPSGRAWIDGRPGRASQQNLGARASARPMLWFLHADSGVDAACVAAARDFAARGADELGYFALRFVDGGALMRINEWGVRYRCRWFGLPFGDQGFLISRATFEALGGFDERRRYGEDMALVQLAKRRSIVLRVLPATLGTSARKYRQQGWLRTTWRHLWSTATLARQLR